MTVSDFFQKVSVSSASFPGSADVTPNLSSGGASLMLLNEGSGSTNVVEFSFDGSTLHGELDPSKPSAGLVFDNRSVNKIYFRVKSGSSGTITVSVTAWVRR